MTTAGSRIVRASRRAPGPSLAGRDPAPKSLSSRIEGVAWTQKYALAFMHRLVALATINLVVEAALFNAYRPGKRAEIVKHSWQFRHDAHAR